MNTQTKLRIARALYWTMSHARRAFGKSDLAQINRRGVTWQLDLREGIDFAIYLFGYFEYETVRAYQRILQPGQTVLDIGANIGAHALHLARCVAPTGKVIAFEPTSYAFGKLTQNISLNPALSRCIQAEQVMLVDSPARQQPPQLYSSWQIHERGSDTHPKHGGLLMDTTGARIRTLDDYLGSQPAGQISFIKIDVDGHECQVLRGARELIRRDKPIILMELMPYGLDETGDSLDALLGILADANYSLYALDGETPLPNDATIRQRISPGGGINVLCRAR